MMVGTDNRPDFVGSSKPFRIPEAKMEAAHSLLDQEFESSGKTKLNSEEHLDKGLSRNWT